MRILILTALMLFCVGCARKDQAKVTVVWHDTTSTPNRVLARQSWELKKGDDIGLFGSGGQLIDFKGSDTAIKVRFIWDDRGIFVEGAEGMKDDWELQRIEAYPMRQAPARFESGISMAAFVKKIE